MTERRAVRASWGLSTAIAAALFALLPVLFDHRFYFVDDSESSAFGQWYKIGTRVLSGDFSVLNPTVWQSGNYLVESAWGVYSPLLWLVGIGSHAATSLVVYLTIVKVAFLVVAAVGTYLVLRSYSVAPHWASIGGVIATSSGVTVYLDAASWANGLMGWALLPLAWWSLRVVVFRGWFPLIGVVAPVTLISISYVHATLMLGVVVIGTFVEALLRRDRGPVLRIVGLGLVAFAAVLIVHLPGALSASATGRESELTNTDLMTVTLDQIIASVVPAGTTNNDFFGGAFPSAPLTYLAWLLPAFVLVPWRRLWAEHRRDVAPLVLLGVAAAILLGPSDVGPLRFPIRVMPFVLLALLVVLTRGLTLREASGPASRPRLVGMLVLTAVGAYFAVSAGPEFLKIIGAVTLVSWVGLTFVFRQTGGRLPIIGTPKRGLRGGLVAAVALTSLALALLQHAFFPSSPLRQYGLPEEVEAYQSQLEGAVGDVIVVGDPGLDSTLDVEIWDEALIGNMWYVDDDVAVQNAYSAVYFLPYSDVTCMAYNGATCGDLWDRLFHRFEGTDVPLVDLLAVSSVLVVDEQVDERIVAPDGWHLETRGESTTLVVRDEPVDGAGGVVWSTEGTEVSEISVSPQHTSFRVDAVGSGRQSVVLSRLPWPGYDVDGAVLADRQLADAFLTIDVGGAEVGDVVTVDFRPPGSTVQVAAASAAVILAAVWSAAWVFGRRRRTTGGAAPRDERSTR